MGVALIWTHDRDAHLALHGITIRQADEAFYEPNALVINPDYASKSGLGIRTIGYSTSYGDLISVLTMIADEGVHWGNTAFRSKAKDRRYYHQE